MITLSNAAGNGQFRMDNFILNGYVEQLFLGTSSATDYRYGFNGKENDNEAKGDGNQQDYGMRIYDPRLGRFLSVDPLFQTYPWYTPYQFAGNKPIIAVDLDGLEEKITIRYSTSQNKPTTELQTAISIFDRSKATTAVANHIMSLLLLEDLKNPVAPPSVAEFGRMGALSVEEQREIIESTVQQFIICIGDFKGGTPTLNTNTVTETYTALFDFNYNLLGNQEKIDDIKNAVKAATTVIEYADKYNEITGQLKAIDKISTISSVINHAIEGDDLGITRDIAKLLVNKGLSILAKKVPSLAPAVGFLKSNPFTMTVTGVLSNSAPEYNFEEIKEKNTEALKMRTIGAMLFLFENNNKTYRMGATLAPLNYLRTPIDHTYVAPRLTPNVQVPPPY